MTGVEGRFRVVAVIQARMGSTRLPGKVLRRLGDRTVLEWVVRAAQEAAGIDDVVVATTSLSADDALAELAQSFGATVVRGSEHDVVSRFALAARESRADAVVRLTSDCPLLDPALISQVVAVWRADPALEYVATTLARTLPRGLDIELLSAGALHRVDGSATGADRVHVTSALYAEHSSAPRAGVVVHPPGDRFRVTLDELADAEAIEAIVRELGNRPPSWREVVALLTSRPDIVALNRHVEQKALNEG